MSVDVESLLHERDLDWKFSLSAHPEHSLVRFVAGVARAEEQEVILRPLRDNPVHCDVVGVKKGRTSKSLSAASEWVRLGPKGRSAGDCVVPNGVATSLN